ncbi:putative hydrolase [Colletotrichum orbiculare MAFF 240422]|uniref:Hydrolase n=1 Tax=Colletotrichum orbiculare (strain 104-T / ATCC 96160 / CBS 514.97 / LARS 414 / MAFF 240422) TaxID=1213857 RepID=N4V624_COLOR|nr:putative hydrolase [Colletotrichum orbiculare MAFF 240422]
MRSSTLLAASLAPLSQAASVPFVPISARQVNNTKQFDWVNTVPTRDLQYHDCYEGLQCARLEVPLDWSNPTKNRTAAIAIVKIPAAVPDDDPSFGGSVLINPGGPSGSGTAFALSTGSTIQTVISGELKYEIIGFDPRGVNLSTPYGDCYKGDELSRKLDEERVSAFAPVDVEDRDTVNPYYASAVAKSKLCEQDGVDSIWGHMNTASVARDMVEIIDRIEDLRWKKSYKEKPKNAPEARLNYLGVSYGSFIGNTFASMFPERVGKLMIDAIVDADDYVQGTWAKNLLDVDEIFDKFYELCYKSGSDCAIYKSTDKSGSDVKTRVNAYLDELDGQPISYVDNNRVRFITSSDVRRVIFNLVYSPSTGFDTIAKGLSNLFAGNYTSFPSINTPAVIDAVCDTNSSKSKAPDYTWFNDAQAGILCSDAAEALVGRNASKYVDILDTIEGQFPGGGAVLATQVPFNCAGRTIKPTYNFSGPFGSPAPSANDSKTPAFPLLITSSRLDPITPLANAVATQKQHAGSSLVIQETIGHGIFSGPSVCVLGIVREFFASGKVPPNGTVCEAVCPPTIPAHKDNCTSPLDTPLNSRDLAPGRSIDMSEFWRNNIL